MDEPIEQYLDTIEAKLTHAGPLERREWREEARQHLVALVEAHEELGLERDRALEGALAQFGDADRIGAALCRAERRRSAVWPGAKWLLGGLLWNAALWNLFLLPELERTVLLVATLYGLGHVASAAMLARAPDDPLPRWAWATAFLPYTAYQLLFTAVAARGLLAGLPGGWLFLSMLAINWGLFAACVHVMRSGRSGGPSSDPAPTPRLA